MMIRMAYVKSDDGRNLNTLGLSLGIFSRGCDIFYYYYHYFEMGKNILGLP